MHYLDRVMNTQLDVAVFFITVTVFVVVLILKLVSKEEKEMEYKKGYLQGRYDTLQEEVATTKEIRRRIDALKQNIEQAKEQTSRQSSSTEIENGNGKIE